MHKYVLIYIINMIFLYQRYWHNPKEIACCFISLELWQYPPQLRQGGIYIIIHGEPLWLKVIPTLGFLTLCHKACSLKIIHGNRGAFPQGRALETPKESISEHPYFHWKLCTYEASDILWKTPLSQGFSVDNYICTPPDAVGEDIVIAPERWSNHAIFFGLCQYLWYKNIIIILIII